MASSLLLVACCLVLQVSWIRAQNCPVIESIFPPSGTLQVPFLVRGNNLTSVREIATDIQVDTPTAIRFLLEETQSFNETHLQFTINGTTLFNPGLRDVTFIPRMGSACPNQSFQLDFKERKRCNNVLAVLLYLCY